MSGSASITLEQGILQHTLGIASMAFPARVYVALCAASLPPSESVGGVEAFGGSYARVPATFALLSSPTNIAANTTSVEFPLATANWGELGYFEIWTAQAGGSRLYWGGLVDPVSGNATTLDVSAGDIVRFSAGTLAVEAAPAATTIASGVSSFNTRVGDVVLSNSDVVAVLPPSPNPPMAPGVAAPGSSPMWARGDHVHPSDKNVRTPFDFGAVGSTATVWNDDTAALNAAFTAIGNEGGGRLYIPGIFYAAGALTVPHGVEVYGNFVPAGVIAGPAAGSTETYFQKAGSKLILGPSGITLQGSNSLRNIMVLAASAPQTNPFGPTECEAVKTAMDSAGTGIWLSGTTVFIDSVQVLGFRVGIQTAVGQAAQHMLRNIHADCTNCIWMDGGGDMCHIIGGHFWPYLTATDQSHGSAGYSGLQRSGVGVWTRANGGSIQITNCTVFGWQICYQAHDNSVTWSQCWADGSAPQSVGFYATGNCGMLQMIDCIAVANPFAVRHSVTNGAVFNMVGSQFVAGGPGGSDPAAGMAICVYADGHGPVQCIGNTFGGGNAMIWLGPNTGPSILTGNMFDDALSNLGYVWHVDAAVIPVLTKHSNRVINSTRGMTEQNPVNPVTGTGLYDSLPNRINGLSSVGAISLAGSGSVITPPIQWISIGSGTDQNVWDAFAGSASMGFRAVNDANSAANPWLTVTRNGYVPQSIALAAFQIALQGRVGFNSTTPIAKPAGWGAPTGTATRTTFATTSVTLPQLAEHVKALIDDLTAYGLIGP